MPLIMPDKLPMTPSQQKIVDKLRVVAAFQDIRVEIRHLHEDPPLSLKNGTLWATVTINPTTGSALDWADGDTLNGSIGKRGSFRFHLRRFYTKEEMVTEPWRLRNLLEDWQGSAQRRKDTHYFPKKSPPLWVG